MTAPAIRTPVWRAAWCMLLAVAGSCSRSERPPGINLVSSSYAFTVSADPSPPAAREAVLFKVVVRDRKTSEPIENGEGRIFATSRDVVNVWDSFTLAPELGTYYGKLQFITAGDWAVAIQFRRDSTHRLERVDWMQDVRPERGGAPR